MWECAGFWPEYINTSYLIIEEFQLTLNGEGAEGESVRKKLLLLQASCRTDFQFILQMSERILSVIIKFIVLEEI
jgi:hypothetical protein